MSASVASITDYKPTSKSAGAGATKTSSNQLATAQGAVKNLKWSSYVPFVSDVLGYGYRPSQDLLDYSRPIAEGSVADGFGHECIGDFITSSEADDGLGLSWKEWESSARAAIYRKTYAIKHTGKEEILSEYSSIEKFLGRKPADAAEFQQVKTDMLKASTQAQVDEHQSEAAEMRKRIQALEGERLEVGRKVDELKEKNQVLTSQKSELASQKSELEVSQADLKSRLDSALSQLDSLEKHHKEQLSDAVASANTRLEEELNTQFRQDTQKLHDLINNLQEELDSVSEKAAADLRRAESMHKAERETILAENKRLEKDLEAAYLRVRELEEEVEKHRTRIGVLSTALDEKERVLQSRGDELIRLAQQGPQDPESLQRIEELEAEVKQFRNESNDLSLELANAKSDLEKTTSERDLLISWGKKTRKESKRLIEESNRLNENYHKACSALKSKSAKLKSATEQLKKHRDDSAKARSDLRKMAKKLKKARTSRLQLRLATGVAIASVALMLTFLF